MNIYKIDFVWKGMPFTIYTTQDAIGDAIQSWRANSQPALSTSLYATLCLSGSSATVLGKAGFDTPGEVNGFVWATAQMIQIFR